MILAKYFLQIASDKSIQWQNGKQRTSSRPIDNPEEQLLQHPMVTMKACPTRAKKTITQPQLRLTTKMPHLQYSKLTCLSNQNV